MKIKLRNSLLFFFGAIVAGQIVFALASKDFTRAHYESSIYATTGVAFDGKTDLHQLTDAAHYFGQTIIGWIKFPSFVPDLIAQTKLPADTTLSAHIQERQNIIFTVTTSTKLWPEELMSVKNYLQSKMDEYNKNTHTQFIFTNVDYGYERVQQTYAFGATVALILSIVLAIAGLFVRKEFVE